MVAALGVAGAPAAASAPAVASAYAVDTVVPDLARRPGGAESSGLVGGERDLAPFTTIGASYRSGSRVDGEVRVHSPRGWSPWFELDGATGSGHGPDPGSAEAATARAASDPIWVGVADGYQLSLPADAAAVRVHLVRATGERVPLAERSSTAAGASEGNSAPPVRLRAAWGARPFRGTIQVNQRLVRGVVHHTVNTNGYTAAQVPSMLRAIQAYHQDTRGWSDIAYNFVVDRFGTIWEARARSYDAAVVGAASSGTNLQTVAVAFLGDGGVDAPAAAVTAIGRTLGWKMRKHGLQPTRANIMGHRDVGQTACPGDALYRQLPEVEDVALGGATPPGPFTDVPWARPDARAIDWARAHGLINGFGDHTFRPDLTVTRGQGSSWLWRFLDRPPSGPVDPTPRADPLDRATAAIWLWRAAGSPSVTLPSGYTDVVPGAHYEMAAAWVQRFTLAPGGDPSTFRGAATMTRAEYVRALYRLAGRPGAWAVPPPSTVRF